MTRNPAGAPIRATMSTSAAFSAWALSMATSAFTFALPIGVLPFPAAGSIAEHPDQA